MNKLKIYSFANRPKITYEKISDKSIVETAGYVSAERKITDLISAGQRLELSRREQFDLDENIKSDGSIDPFRKPGLDMAEASQIIRTTAQKIRAIQRKKAQQKPTESPTPPVPPPEKSGEGEGFKKAV